MIKGLVIGAVGTLAALALAFYLVAANGWIPANADAQPPRVEKWIAKTALDAAIDRGMPQGKNPIALNDKNVIEGIRLYAVDCKVCHGAADAKPSDIAVGLYQKGPQLAKYGVEDDEEGETYWKIYHGIRMTGMPSFRDSLTNDQIWKITLFLKNMDSLSPAAQKAWKAVPSAARKTP